MSPVKYRSRNLYIKLPKKEDPTKDQIIIKCSVNVFASFFSLPVNIACPLHVRVCNCCMLG